jgi:Ser/Thr protein kinase RdoA (MazF antagonist)
VEPALQNGRLSGILDFELAHWDHRVGDFALSWRGKYDEVIHGYAEVSPLAPEEWALLTPLWWAGLIEGACQDLRNGTLMTAGRSENFCNARH